MTLDRLDHLVITTGDIEKSLHFYVDVLNMTPDYRENRYAVRFGRQKINFHLRKGEYLPAAKNPTHGSQDLCLIAVGDIEEIKVELEAKGCDIELGIVERLGALGPMKSVFLRDPDGNLIEISVYRE